MPTTTETTPTLDLTYVRSQFPSLSQTVNGHPAVFLDGPGGTQVPQRVIDAISAYLCHDNANTGGAYTTSRNTDAMIARARSMASTNSDSRPGMTGSTACSVIMRVPRSRAEQPVS